MAYEPLPVILTLSVIYNNYQNTIQTLLYLAPLHTNKYTDNALSRQVFVNININFFILMNMVSPI